METSQRRRERGELGTTHDADLVRKVEFLVGELQRCMLVSHLYVDHSRADPLTPKGVSHPVRRLTGDSRRRKQRC